MRMHPIIENTVRRVGRFHARLYRWSGGTGRLGRDTLVLTTRSRKTGREIPAPLYYVAEGELLYIVASFGGNDNAPQWYGTVLI